MLFELPAARRSLETSQQALQVCKSGAVPGTVTYFAYIILDMSFWCFENTTFIEYDLNSFFKVAVIRNYCSYELPI